MNHEGSDPNTRVVRIPIAQPASRPTSLGAQIGETSLTPLGTGPTLSSASSAVTSDARGVDTAHSCLTCQHWGLSRDPRVKVSHTKLEGQYREEDVTKPRQCLRMMTKETGKKDVPGGQVGDRLAAARALGGPADLHATLYTRQEFGCALHEDFVPYVAPEPEPAAPALEPATTTPLWLVRWGRASSGRGTKQGIFTSVIRAPDEGAATRLIEDRCFDSNYGSEHYLVIEVSPLMPTTGVTLANDKPEMLWTTETEST